MNPTPRIEDLIPHRAGLLLIDRIIEVNPAYAVTAATVKAHWPLLAEASVSPLVLIELAAQTAGICLGWNEMTNPTGSQKHVGGWLVGIKRAAYYVDCITVGTCILTRCQTQLTVEQYKEIVATARIDDRLVADIHLQVLQADKTAFTDLSAMVRASALEG
jgi:predicted hotdog family 3-hydroxylacyl-ACP dehydratase